MKPRVAITEGDPAGIGPEIARRAAADPRVLAVCEPVLYGAGDGERFAPGVLSAAAGRAAYDCHRSCHGRRAAWRGRRPSRRRPSTKKRCASPGCPGTATPISLAHLTGAAHVAMMFYSDELRVVLATVHVAARRRAAAADAAS